MLFLNRSKKAVALALLIALMPVPAHAWGLNALWNTVKQTVKENPWIATGVAVITAIYLYNDFTNWKKAQTKNNQPNTRRNPTTTQSNAKKPSTALTASKLKHTYQGHFAHASFNARSAARSNSAQTKAAVSLEPMSAILDALETLIKQFAQQMVLLNQNNKSALQRNFNKMYIQLYNLKLRCKPINEQLTQRFNGLFQEINAHKQDKITPQELYPIIGFTKYTPLPQIHAVIQQKETVFANPLMKIFSCTLAKENFDAFLEGSAAMNRLEIKDEQSISRINTLSHQMEQFKEKLK